MSRSIEDCALIGDRRSAALVSRTGSIDWLCWPRFDSDACFAALLGDGRHGFWSIRPVDAEHDSQRWYRPGTLVLETRHRTAGGSVRVTDSMPMQGGGAIIRQIDGEEGVVEMALEIRLRFDYGTMSPWLSAAPRCVVGIVGPDLVVLRSDLDLVCSDDRTTAQFPIKAGESVCFTLQYGLAYQAEPCALDVAACVSGTERYWRRWVAGFSSRTGHMLGNFPQTLSHLA